jgi:hypothetical protein
MPDVDVTVRRARPADALELARLAELDSHRPLVGDLLVAEDGRDILAALDLRTGAEIADPFRPSAAAVALLRVRAEQLQAPAAAVRRRLRSLARLAA